MLIFGGATVFFCQLYCILYMILSMEEHVGPVEVGSLSHYWQGFMHSKCLAGFLPSTIWLLTAIAIVWCLERLCWTQKSWTYLAEVPTPSSPKHHCLPSFFLFSLHFFSPEHERFLNLKITRFQRTIIWTEPPFLDWKCFSSRVYDSMDHVHCPRSSRNEKTYFSFHLVSL